jgi:hypothetical protein
MRKILLIIFAIIALSACKENIENVAIKQMEKTFERAGGETSGVETIYKTDSICIIHLNCERRGRYYKLEYIYILDKSGDEDLVRWELVRDLDKEKSIMECAKETYERHDWTDDSRVGKLPERERKDAILLIEACIKAYMSGHKIDKKKDVYNPDNW